MSDIYNSPYLDGIALDSGYSSDDEDNDIYDPFSVKVADEFSKDYMNNIINELYKPTLTEIQDENTKIINEINPNVLANEQDRYLKEIEAYAKKQNEIKVKYKKPPVADVRGEIYREEKDNANRNIGLAALGIAAGLGALGFVHRKAIGRGLEIASEYGRSKSHAIKNADNEPTKRQYMRDMSVFNVLPYRSWKKEQHNTAMNKTGVSDYNRNIFTNPMQSIGETIGRTAYDIASHGTQSYLWRVHPLDLAGQIGRRGIDQKGKLGGPGQALLLMAAVQPAIALTGAYDVTNPSELFRPKGFKQNNPESLDPTKTTAPGEELFSRFMMGRTGRPLKYSDAKEEIPDLTPGRYKDYMRYMYQDKGFLNLGLAKSTGENLQGVPEARVLGYPVTIDAMSTFGGALAGTKLGMSLVPDKPVEVKKEKPKYSKEDYLRAIENDVPIDGEQPGREIKKGDKRYLLAGLAGSALGSIGGHFLGKFIESQFKKGSDERRAAEEYAEHGYKPKGYYLTDGNNNPIIM